MNPSYCRECGSKLTGRTDKKYCHDNCRSAFNNRKNRVVSNLIRATNQRLVRNYRILQELNTQKTTTVSRNMLLDAGLDFKLHTATDTNKDGGSYCYIYDLGYLALDDDLFLLVQKDS